MKRALIGLVAVALCGGCGSRVRDWPEELSRTHHLAHVDPKTLLIVREEFRDQSEDSVGETSTRTLRSMTPA